MTISHTWTLLWMTAGSRPALGVLNRGTETLHFPFQKASTVLVKRNSKPLRWWRKHIELGRPSLLYSVVELNWEGITDHNLSPIRLPEAEWHVCPCLRDGLNEENTFHCMSWTGLCVTNSDSSSHNWVTDNCQHLPFWSGSQDHQTRGSYSTLWPHPWYDAAYEATIIKQEEADVTSRVSTPCTQYRCLQWRRWHFDMLWHAFNLGI